MMAQEKYESEHFLVREKGSSPFMGKVGVYNVRYEEMET